MSAQTCRQLMEGALFDLNGRPRPVFPDVEELVSRVEKVLAKCEELSARDKRTNFKGEGGISIALVLRLLNGEDKP